MAQNLNIMKQEMMKRKRKITLNESQTSDSYLKYADKLQMMSEKNIETYRKELESELSGFEKICDEVIYLIGEEIELVSILEDIEGGYNDSELDSYINEYYGLIRENMAMFKQSITGTESHDLIANTSSNPYLKIMNLKKYVLDEISELKNIKNRYSKPTDQNLSESKLQKLVRQVIQKEIEEYVKKK